MFIACDERPKFAKLLVEQGHLLKINLNQQDSLGRTPMIIACQNKKFVQTFFFKLLVAKLLYFREDQGIRNPVKENVISFMIQYSTGSQKFVSN